MLCTHCAEKMQQILNEGFLSLIWAEIFDNIFNISHISLCIVFACNVCILFLQYEVLKCLHWMNGRKQVYCTVSKGRLGGQVVSREYQLLPVCMESGIFAMYMYLLYKS